MPVLVHKFNFATAAVSAASATVASSAVAAAAAATAGRFSDSTATCLWWAGSLSMHYRPAPRVTTAVTSYRHAAALFGASMADERFSDGHTEHRGRYIDAFIFADSPSSIPRTVAPGVYQGRSLIRGILRFLQFSTDTPPVRASYLVLLLCCFVVVRNVYIAVYYTNSNRINGTWG